MSSWTHKWTPDRIRCPPFVLLRDTLIPGHQSPGWGTVGAYRPPMPVTEMVSQARRRLIPTRDLASLLIGGGLLLAGSSARALTPSATSSNPEVLPASSIAFIPNGSVFNVTLTLAPDAAGTTILNFFATEGTDTARLIPPFVPVTNAPPPPNLPPTLNPIPDVTINEDSGQQTVALGGQGLALQQGVEWFGPSGLQGDGVEQVAGLPWLPGQPHQTLFL